MCERLLNKGVKTLTELEIIDLFWFAGQPSGDTKRLVKIPDPAV